MNNEDFVLGMIRIDRDYRSGNIDGRDRRRLIGELTTKLRETRVAAQELGISGAETNMVQCSICQ